MVFGLVTLGQILLNLAQGFAFGTGYGSGVRFGFEDVYPFFKNNAQGVMQFLGLSDPEDNEPPNPMQNTYTQSGFKQASGITRQEGFTTLF